MVESAEFRTLIRDFTEMNQQELLHCERCHSAIKSDSYHFDSARAIVHYDPPKRCNVCKSTNYTASELVPALLPKADDGVKCKCKFPGCGKEFINRPKWYVRQQEIAKNTDNPYMPELTETDPVKLEIIEKLKLTEKERKEREGVLV